MEGIGASILGAAIPPIRSVCKIFDARAQMNTMVLCSGQ